MLTSIESDILCHLIHLLWLVYIFWNSLGCCEYVCCSFISFGRFQSKKTKK